MADLKLLPDEQGEKMFEIVLREVPEIMREVFRDRLVQVVAEKAQGAAVTQEHILETVNEVVPDPLRTKILKAFELIGGVDLARAEKIIEKNPGGGETLITILHAVQDHYGYVPREVLVLISRKKDVFLSTLYRLVTSYRAFRIDKPKGHVITLCTGTGCHVNGGSNIFKDVETKAARRDPGVLVEKVRCLGCCDVAPAAVIDGRVYSGADAQAKLSEIID